VIEIGFIGCSSPQKDLQAHASDEVHAPCCDLFHLKDGGTQGLFDK
jgi:hypothetical protein